MPNQIEVKSVLAKLLATEDIDIVHDAKAPTAAFDVKNRKLYLPVWKNMSNSMYDLFIGHEVGHAHETPEEGWHDAVCDTPELKAFYNIIEDARIERKVKERYPGLVKSFHRGYQELFDKDFFGVKDRDLSTLPFVDRVNLHFKIGHLLGLQFTETEKGFLDRVAKTETWEDVKALSLELADISRKEAEERQEELEPLQQVLDDLMTQMNEAEESTPSWDDYKPEHMKQEESDDEGEEGEGEGEGEGEEDPNLDEYGNPKPGTPGGPQGEDETDEEYSDRRDKEWQEEQKQWEEDRKRRAAEYDAETKARELFDKDVANNEETKKELQEEIEETRKMHDFLSNEGQKSITDDAFRDNEKSLVDLDAREIVYLKPQRLHKASEWVIPMDKLYDWDNCIELQGETDEGRYFDYGNPMPKEEMIVEGKKMYKEFLSSTQPVINSMAQTFELKKAAAANKKAQVAKTGKLNEDKLWAYQLTEDLFQKNMIVPNGKNHGIIMYVDLSGSMNRQMPGTLEQTMNMALFCRKVNIPFDVYGFSNCRYSETYPTPWSENKDMNRSILEAREDGEMVITDSNFALVHMLSSTCKKSDFDNAMAYLLLMKLGYSNRGYWSKGLYGYIQNDFFRLGGTPLNSALVLAPSIAKDFQKKYAVEKLTTVFLTDGGATDSITYRDTSSEHRAVTSVYGEPIAIKHEGSTTQLPNKDGYSRRDGVTTQTLVEFYKRITGSTLINFHIVDGKREQFYSEYVSTDWMEGKDPQHWVSTEFIEGTWKDVLKNKFTVVQPAFGYDARFLLKGQKDLEIGVQELDVKSNKKGDLLRGFKKFSKGKSTSRTFLNQIIELVA